MVWKLLFLNYFSSYFLGILVLQTGFEIIGYTPFNTSVTKKGHSKYVTHFKINMLGFKNNFVYIHCKT